MNIKPMLRNSQKTKRSNRPKKQARDNVLSSLLALPAGRAMLTLSCRAQLSPADAIAPPGTVLDEIVTRLNSDTDLPPMLGVASAMAAISAALVASGSTVKWPGETDGIELDLWLIALAPSGAGKTWVRAVVNEGIGISSPELPEPGSAPAMIHSLATCDGRAYWPRDEYGQLMRAIADGGPRGDLRDVLLRVYDHSELVHNTVSRGETRVEKPVVTIFGTSVDTTWADCIDAQMLADGLLARHLFIVAEARALRVPRYPKRAIVSSISASSIGITDRLKGRNVYEISPEAAAVYDGLWHELVGELNGSLDSAYVRRITWTAAKYAVIYHLILGRDGHRVGVTAMRWAWRMVMSHCFSTKLVLSTADQTLAGRIERISNWVAEQQEGGTDVWAPTFVRRLIQQFRRDLKGVHEAKQILDIVRPPRKAN